MDKKLFMWKNDIFFIEKNRLAEPFVRFLRIRTENALILALWMYFIFRQYPKPAFQRVVWFFYQGLYLTTTRANIHLLRLGVPGLGGCPPCSSYAAAAVVSTAADFISLWKIYMRWMHFYNGLQAQIFPIVRQNNHHTVCQFCFCGIVQNGKNSLGDFFRNREPADRITCININKLSIRHRIRRFAGPWLCNGMKCIFSIFFIAVDKKSDLSVTLWNITYSVKPAYFGRAVIGRLDGAGTAKYVCFSRFNCARKSKWYQAWRSTNSPFFRLTFSVGMHRLNHVPVTGKRESTTRSCPMGFPNVTSNLRTSVSSRKLLPQSKMMEKSKPF